MQKGEFFVTGEVFLLDIGLLMGAIMWKTPFTHLHMVTSISITPKNPFRTVSTNQKFLYLTFISPLVIEHRNRKPMLPYKENS